MKRVKAPTRYSGICSDVLNCPLSQEIHQREIVKVSPLRAAREQSHFSLTWITFPVAEYFGDTTSQTFLIRLRHLTIDGYRNITPALE